MFNYKRLTFIFAILTFLLISTDSYIEKQSRRGLLSLINVVAEESSEVSGSAPSSLLDTAENTRLALGNFLSKQAENFSIKSDSSKGALSVVFMILEYLFLLFKFLASYVITFYPFIIFLLYSFFSSRFFRRDEFSYNNY